MASHASKQAKKSDALIADLRKTVAVLLPSRSRLLVAVSGGVDSMVLLHALGRLRDEFQWKLFVAYFNHQLRPNEDELDQRLVQRFCRKNDIPLYQGRWKSSRENSDGLSLEMSARSARHAFLGAVATKKRAMVVMGHHADDQVELFLMRLLRGAGGEGLGGMRAKSRVEGFREITLLRPFLSFRKRALIDYAKSKLVGYNEDSSNRNIDLERNLVRHRLLPYLQKHWGKGLHATCLRTMKIVSAEHSFAELTALTWLVCRKPVPFSKAGSFAKLDTAVQRQIIRIQMIQLGVFPEFNRIEELRTRIGKRVSVAKDKQLTLAALGKLSVLEDQIISDESPLILKLVGRTLRHEGFGGKLIARFTTRPDAFHQGTEYFDAAKIGGKLQLRNWRQGDRFQPIGMKSPVKLQDLFVNQKIPKQFRHQLLIAEDERGVLFWVEGLRIGEAAKTDSGTSRYLKWQWTRD